MLFSRAKLPNRSVLLVILDGWGDAPAWGGNAITSAETPSFDRLQQSAFSTTLAAAGVVVGLPGGEPGNSEVGHLTIGAGRSLQQERVRIGSAIEDGSFFSNPMLIAAMQRARAENQTLHLIGLASAGGVHGHIDHLHALLELAKRIGVGQVAIHAITDGRDAPPQQAAQILDKIRHWCTELGIGTIASIVGRYYAMDRDKHWDRIERAYRLLTEPTITAGSSALAAISAAYTAGVTDEFIEPIWLKAHIPPIHSGDSVICWNYRPDRSRELLEALTDATFTAFKRTSLDNLAVVTLVQYWPNAAHPAVTVAFPPAPVANTLGAVVSVAGYEQLRIAESEKYAHVTYFLNGGQEQPLVGESRQLIPSRLTASPIERPAMQTLAIARAAAAAVHKRRYGLIVANIAAPDMVGHTGNLQATVQACEVVDQAISSLIDAAKRTDTVLIITADHGNAEQLVNPVTNEPDTHHTPNPVPFVLIDPTGHVRGQTKPQQTLADVAPTVLTILGLNVPHSMTGQSLAIL